LQLAEQRLRTRLDAALRRVYGLRGFEAALSEKRQEMMFEVRDQISPDAKSLGLQIDDVRIRRTDLTAEVSDQTYARMNAERLAEAERLRARGQEAARRIRARADREVVEIKAAAQRDAEVLRGEGEGERNAIFADAFGRDPEFFEFYRSMSAYSQALNDSGTTMVLSPNSDFFRYFQDPSGSSRRPAAGNTTQ
jgi:membrane protease subunit HflC